MKQAGRARQTLAPAPNTPSVGGGTWSAEGVIVFANSLGGPLKRVSASGGAEVAVTTVGPQQLGHVLPSFYPTAAASCSPCAAAGRTPPGST